MIVTMLYSHQTKEWGVWVSELEVRL
jgi:hypothetical protein